MKTDPRSGKLAVLGVLVLSLIGRAAIADEHSAERVPFKASFAVAGRVIFIGTPDYTQQYLDRCHMAPVDLIEGAGDASFLGTMTDVQSHCLGNQDPTDPQRAAVSWRGVYIHESGRTDDHG